MSGYAGISRERFLEASEFAGIRYLSHEEAIDLESYGFEQSARREEAERLAKEREALLIRIGSSAEATVQRADAAEERARVAEMKLDRVLALAEEWRYKGEFGWGPWQGGYGPDQEGWVLDQASAELRKALTP